MKLKVTDVDTERLIELNISIEDMGTHIRVVEYPPKPSGWPTKVLFRAKYREEEVMYEKWWERRIVVWQRRPWVVIIHLDQWTWYDSVFRFNGGGYMYGADPYKEWTVGCVTVRRHGGVKATGGGTGPV